MIYEQRIYQATPGKLPALLARFREHTLKIWERHGIRQAGFFTTLIGASSNDLTYYLAWESMAEREQKWTAFATDPVWLVAKAESEENGPIIDRIISQFLAPTDFSSVK